MNNSQVAKAYAKSIYSLGKETNVDIASEYTRLTEVINSSNNLEIVLFLDVFSIDDKKNVITEIMNKLSLSSLAKNAINFLIEEKRIGIFPQIYKEIIVIDDHEKGFLRGTIEGSDDVPSEEFISGIKAYLEKKLGKKTDLKYTKTDKITAGYRVTVEDLQLDASLDNQLGKLKQQILNS